MNNKPLSSMNETTYANLPQALDFAINKRLRDVNTILECEVIAINTDATLNLEPMVNSIKTDGTPISPPILYNVPTMLIVGGSAGFLVEYVKGDIVLVGFCQRDMSASRSSKKRANPSTRRIFSLSDGIVIGYAANKTLTTYIKVTSDGNIKIVGQNVTVQSQEANIEANQVNLGVNATQNVLITGVAFNASITNVQAGTDTVNAVITPSVGGSTTVKASV